MEISRPSIDLKIILGKKPDEKLILVKGKYDINFDIEEHTNISMDEDLYGCDFADYTGHYIYILKSDSWKTLGNSSGKKLYKIGKTTRSGERDKQLKTGNPYPIQYIAKFMILNFPPDYVEKCDGVWSIMLHRLEKQIHCLPSHINFGGGTEFHEFSCDEDALDCIYNKLISTLGMKFRLFIEGESCYPPMIYGKEIISNSSEDEYEEKSEHFTDDEIDGILPLLNKEKYGIRNICILKLCIHTGFRIEELLSVKLNERNPFEYLYVEKRYTRKKIQTKRIILDDEMKKCIKEYLNSYKDIFGTKYDKKSYLFPCDNDIYKPIELDKIENIYENAFKENGINIDKKLYTHYFRKTYINNLCSNIGINDDIINLIKKIDNMDVTTISGYLHRCNFIMNFEDIDDILGELSYADGIRRFQIIGHLNTKI